MEQFNIDCKFSILMLQVLNLYVTFNLDVLAHKGGRKIGGGSHPRPYLPPPTRFPVTAPILHSFLRLLFPGGPAEPTVGEELITWGDVCARRIATSNGWTPVRC
jgi:hypothetical protein